MIDKIQNIQGVESVEEIEDNKLLVSTYCEKVFDEGDLIIDMSQRLAEEIETKDAGVDALEDEKYIIEKVVRGSSKEKFEKYAAFYGGVLGMNLDLITMVVGYPYEGQSPRSDSAAHLYNLGVDPMSDTTLEDISKVTG